MSDLIDKREILRTWQNVCIGISCSKCQFYNDDAMNGDCLFERWVHSLPSAQPVDKDINVPVKDCISRQAVIDARYNRWN